LKILYCSPEVAPFSKTGGLGDVAWALPKALAGLGHDVRVVTPLYAAIETRTHGIREKIASFSVQVGDRSHKGSLWEGVLPGTGVPVYFIGCPEYFDRKGLYQENGKDYPDNLQRFVFFCRALLELPRWISWKPHVVHANDWQTALVPVYLKTLVRGTDLYHGIRTVLTIHNLGYPGLFDREMFPQTGLAWDLFAVEGLEFYGKGNLLKGGILFADRLTTVSPTYGREILTPEYGFGLEGLFRRRAGDLEGVLNGADYDEWDPALDPHIARTYSPRSLLGKQICKKALQKECGFKRTDVPLVGMISRLDNQKGIDLIKEIMDEIMQCDLQMVVLGSGMPAYQSWLKDLAGKYPERFSVSLAFDNGLAHRIEAGSDIFLMPSRYEPCGLNQLYSLKYGTLPVARRTGGLADTITDFAPSTVRRKSADGFLFDHYASSDLLKVLLLATQVYGDKKIWKQMMKTAMEADFSWRRSAEDYGAVYRKALSQRRESQ
jgi:starch synthase